MTVVSPLLAHYGGLDEIGFFVVPAVAVILLLRWAERRAGGRREPNEHERDGTDR